MYRNNRIFSVEKAKQRKCLKKLRWSVMNFLSLLLSIILVHSDQSKVPLRSLKLSGNITYDCIDIYKQPGLNHPLLKTHKIQMKPTFSRTEFKNHTDNDKPYFKKRIGCPIGTVPILKNMEEFITSSQHLADKYLHPLSVDNAGIHVAGVRSRNGPFHGVEAIFSGHNLNLKKGQATYSQIYITSELNNQFNFISSGLMIHPDFFPDTRVWSFGFWKGKNGKGCFNTACYGFVQVSKEILIVEPLDFPPEKHIGLHHSIHQDKNTENWWLTLKSNTGNVDIGYWPKELFNLFDYGANMVGVGGEVHGSHSGLSPPMGNGNFPNWDRTKSALFTNIEVLNSNYEQRKMNSFPIEKLLDSPKCYGLKIGKIPLLYHTKLGFFF